MCRDGPGGKKGFTFKTYGANCMKFHAFSCLLLLFSFACIMNLKKENFTQNLYWLSFSTFTLGGGKENPFLILGFHFSAPSIVHDIDNDMEQ